MTGDPPLLFSRSWRQNFKDPHRGQKHSLGPLIITTGVPLFGRGALSRVQNCSAGVPRAEPPFTSSSRHRSSLVLPLVRILPSSHGRSIDLQNIFFSLYQFPSIRPTFINIFVRAPPWKRPRSRHNQEPRRDIVVQPLSSRSRVQLRSRDRPATCWNKTDRPEEV